MEYNGIKVEPPKLMSISVDEIGTEEGQAKMRHALVHNNGQIIAKQQGRIYPEIATVIQSTQSTKDGQPGPLALLFCGSW